MRAEIGGGGREIRGDEPRDETLVAFIVAGENGGFAHVRVLDEDAIDFAKLDAKAANFHLLIHSSEIFDVAARESACEVAGAVDFFPGRCAEWMVDESFSREFGTTEVAACEAFASDEDFAGDADGDRAQMGIEDVELEVGNGRADDAAALHVVGAERAVGDVDGRLGDAIHIHELRFRVAVAGEPRREALHFQRFTAEDDEAQCEFLRAP